MEDPEQFDGLYMTILQKGQGIQNFFDSFFGFLYRKSDFFADKEKSREFVETNYTRYMKKFEEKKEKEERKKRKEEEEKQKQKEKGATVKEITHEEFERRKAEEEKRRLQEQAKTEIKVDNVETIPTTTTTTTTTTENKEEKEEDKIAPGKMRPGPGNGGITDTYSWTQHDIKEINISIPVPSNVRGKDVKVKYDPKEICVNVLGKDLLKGEWFHFIKPDTFLWSIEEVKQGKVITIYFEKSDNYKWWDCILKGETPIDTSKINPEPSKISDIEDPEMRAQIEKMMFDTRQKQQGMPTSDELQKNNMLDQFKKAHPEMDFSKAKFS